MLDSYRGDILFRLMLDERWREMERTRVLLAHREPGIGARLTARFGGLLVRMGRRLQTAATPATPILLVDPCRGCAN